MPLHTLSESDGDWAVAEALLLVCADASRWSPATSTRRCKAHTTLHAFPAPNTPQHVRTTPLESVAVTRVAATLHCQLQTFIAFITTPQNAQYYEAGVVSSALLAEVGKHSALVRTVYAGRPPVDVVALHARRTLCPPNSTHAPNPKASETQRAELRVVEGGDAEEEEEEEVDKWQTVRQQFVSLHKKAASRPIHICAVRSVPAVREDSAGRRWVHLSATIAYELRAGRMRLVTLRTANTPYVTDAETRMCVARVWRMRRLCEMLHRMVDRGSLALRAAHAERLRTASPEPRRPIRAERTPILLSEPLRSLTALLTRSGLWRSLPPYQGCEAELLKERGAFGCRLTVHVWCSLTTFRQVTREMFVSMASLTLSPEEARMEGLLRYEEEEEEEERVRRGGGVYVLRILPQSDPGYSNMKRMEEVSIEDSVVGFVALPMHDEPNPHLRVHHMLYSTSDKSANNVASLISNALQDCVFRLTQIRKCCEEGREAPVLKEEEEEKEKDGNKRYEEFAEVVTMEDAAMSPFLSPFSSSLLLLSSSSKSPSPREQLHPDEDGLNMDPDTHAKNGDADFDPSGNHTGGEHIHTHANNNSKVYLMQQMSDLPHSSLDAACIVPPLRLHVLQREQIIPDVIYYCSDEILGDMDTIINSDGLPVSEEGGGTLRREDTLLHEVTPRGGQSPFRREVHCEVSPRVQINTGEALNDTSSDVSVYDSKTEDEHDEYEKNEPKRLNTIAKEERTCLPEEHVRHGALNHALGTAVISEVEITPPSTARHKNNISTREEEAVETRPDGSVTRKSEKLQRVTFCILHVSGITDAMGIPLRAVACRVRVETRSEYFCTHVSRLRRLAVFNETFSLHITTQEVIRITVLAGTGVAGVVLIRPCAHLGVVRTHAAIRAAGTGDAIPGAFVSIALASRKAMMHLSHPTTRPLYASDEMTLSQFGCTKDSDPERERRIRLGCCLWENARDALHRLDLLAASNRHLRHSLLTTPPQWELRVGLHRWDPKAETDSPNPVPSTHTTSLPSARRRISAACVYATVQVGLHHWQCATSATDGTAALFVDTTTFHGVLPARDELLIAVATEGKESEEGVEELGIAVLPIRAVAGKSTRRHVIPLTHRAGTRDAFLLGAITLELRLVHATRTHTPKSTHVSPRDIPKEAMNMTSYRLDLWRLFYHRAPELLHRVDCLLAEHAGKEAALLRSLEARYGATTSLTPSPLHVRLIGLRDFAPSRACYVKGYYNGEPFLRTQDYAGALQIHFDGATASATVMLDDPYHARLRFKVAHHRYLHSTVLAFTELRPEAVGCISAPGGGTRRHTEREDDSVRRCWLPLFDPLGVSIGHLGVELRGDFRPHPSALSPRMHPYPYAETSTERGMDAWGLVESDLASLLQRYRGAELVSLQPHMTATVSLAAAHPFLRSRLVQRPVNVTLMIMIHAINLFDSSRSQRLDIVANYGDDESQVSWPSKEESRSVTLRLDVMAVKSMMSRNGLLLSVRRARFRASRSHAPLPPAAEVGRTVASLRALLCPALYSPSEVVALPLIAVSPNVSEDANFHVKSNRYVGGISSVGKNGVVVGHLHFSVRPAALEATPRELQMDPNKLSRCRVFNKAYVRKYEERIASLLAKHEPCILMNLHYTLYERDVASGQWSPSLRHWWRTLQRRFGSNLNREALHALSPRRRGVDNAETSKTDKSSRDDTGDDDDEGFKKKEEKLDQHTSRALFF